ncbi:PREDICTED: xenotropic and polytropic retrovirus receptor 1 homolog, partial [Priapulus caudatus]|uniref:Xenotropic and polytropic retrovirus receptor 1 homolog n=1 Tax=Priapulus caudatus TaxID=37621 RepID=A0ABM1EGE1_PRICU
MAWRVHILPGDHLDQFVSDDASDYEIPKARKELLRKRARRNTRPWQPHPLTASSQQAQPREFEDASPGATRSFVHPRPWLEKPREPHPPAAASSQSRLQHPPATAAAASQTEPRELSRRRRPHPAAAAVETPWTTFRVGLFSGIVLVLSISIVLSALFVEVPTDWRPALRMYRGAFLVVLFCFLLSVNTYGWRSSGVNHVLIFELDPRDNLDHQQLSEVASFLMMVWCLSGLSYMYGDIIMIKSLVQPLVLILFMITFLLNPFKCFYHSARFWLLKVIWRIVTAPFHHVGFADFWLADQLNSLTAVIIDMQYFVCFYAFSFDWSSFTASGSTEFKSDVCMSNIYGLRPLISCLPAWWRFVQCLRRYRDTRLAFPHLANAGKYSTTFFVVLFSSLHKWQKGLQSYYYFAVIEDLILRLSWTTNLVNWQLVDEDVLMTLLALLEVSRRFIWNFFRLENEHLNNCGQFRAVRDISVAPLSTNDLYMILHMMDEPDGVVHRRKNRLKNKFGKSLKKADTKLWLSRRRVLIGGEGKAKTRGVRFRERVSLRIDAGGTGRSAACVRLTTQAKTSRHCPAAITRKRER